MSIDRGVTGLVGQINDERHQTPPIVSLLQQLRAHCEVASRERSRCRFVRPMWSFNFHSKAKLRPFYSLVASITAEELGHVELVSGWDGDVYIGRIRQEPHGLMQGKWQWRGKGPRVREQLLPHVGYADAGRQTATAVERYYERLVAHNGGAI